MASVLPHISRLKRSALALLFPEWCVGCGREGDFICLDCRRSLHKISHPVCPRCGRPQVNGVLCSACVGWPAEIDGIRAPFVFEGVIRQAIHELKYRNLRAIAVPMAELLYEYLTDNPLSTEVLVPVPLHPRRWRERGYNQSALLARHLGRLTGTTVVVDCLIRRSQAHPQARAASAAERRRNVAEAFACRDNRLAGKKVLLIDDVATSGATLDACAAALKASGAVSVWGLVMATEL